jgi:hypothetical protein
MVERVYHRVLMALRSFLRRGTVEQELDEELQFHFDQMQEFSVSRGDDLSDARWRARRHMGSVDSVKEACRDMRTLRLVEHVLTDLRFGARLLVRGPGFTTVAVLSLALGIGSSSAIVSVINAIVLRSLPIADPQELHIAQAMELEEVEQFFPYPVVARAAELLAGRAQVAAQSSVESALIATREGGLGASPPEAAQLQLVAGDFFGTLRQHAQIGRLLGPDDNRTLGQHPVAVISDRYWSRRFGRSGRVLDAELIINGSSMAIVGVAAREFFGRQFVVRDRSVRSRCVRDGGRRACRCFCVCRVYAGTTSVAPRSDDCAKDGVTTEVATPCPQICATSNRLIGGLRHPDTLRRAA